MINDKKKLSHLFLVSFLLGFLFFLAPNIVVATGTPSGTMTLEWTGTGSGNDDDFTINTNSTDGTYFTLYKGEIGAMTTCGATSYQLIAFPTTITSAPSLGKRCFDDIGNNVPFVAVAYNYSGHANSNPFKNVNDYFIASGAYPSYPFALKRYMFIGGVMTEMTGSQLINDDFDSYTLGNINGKGCWTTSDGTRVTVSTTTAIEQNSLKFVTNGSASAVCSLDSTDYSNTVQNLSGSFYSDGHVNANNGFFITILHPTNSVQVLAVLQQTNGGNTLRMESNGITRRSDIPHNTWHDFNIEITYGATTTSSICISLDNDTPTCTATYAGINTGVTGIQISQSANIDDITTSYFDNFGSGTMPETETITRIIDISPADDPDYTNILSSPVTFGLHAYVNPDDIEGNTDIRFTLHNIDQNVLLLSAFSPSDIYLLRRENATTSGHFYFSTTTVLADGNYRIKAIIEKSYLWGLFTNPWNVDEVSHEFQVGSSTYIGTMTGRGYRMMQDLIGNDDAFGTSTTITDINRNIAGNCSPFSGIWNVTKCMGFLLVPDSKYLQDTINDVKYNVLNRPPWGYVMRVYDMFNSTTTVALPAFTANIQIGAGSSVPDNTSITIDPADMVAGAGLLLADLRDPHYGKNVRDVFEPMVWAFVSLSVLFTILADLMGSHKHNQATPKENTKKLS